MNFVEPIRDRRKIAQIKNQLRGQNRYRDLLLFTMGINSALRISDLLRLQISHILDTDNTPVERFWIREEKTGKRYELHLNGSINEAIEQYLAAYPNVVNDRGNFIFFNTKTMDYSQSIKRGHAWKTIRQLCEDVGLTGEYGTHTLRKTWAYHARQNGVDIETIMNRLNHTSISSTMRYIGITDDELLAVMRKLNL